ncbi:MAG: DNRLRE domain-containing protein [Crocinitomicaceae bacterium]
MKKRLLIICISFVCFFTTFGQTTLTLQPNSANGKDARINSLDTYTTGTDIDLPIAAWTFGGPSGTDRVAIGFDLSSISSSSTIVSAKLYLYGSSTLPSGGHSTTSGSNDVIVQRITSNWNENSVAWSTQPSVSSINQVTMPASTSAYEDYIVDVKNLVEDMKNDPSNSFGFMFKLATEVKYRRMDFCSSNHPDSTKHPKLVVVYADCPTLTLTLQPGSTLGQDARINSLNTYTNGNDIDLPVAAWTFNGPDGTDRTLINFDISPINSNDNILSAELYLYGSVSLPSGGHSTLSGSNDAIVQRVTSYWDESTVSWSAQPSVTSVNQTTIPASTSIDEDYMIDVTNLVQDMKNDPSNSFGFLLQESVETKYRRLDFCSSDHPDSTKHPKLVVIYDHCRLASIDENKLSQEIFSVYPNPSNSIINISLIEGKGYFEIYNVEGKLIVDKSTIEGNQQINISQWENGYYFVRVTTDKTSETKKIIKN